MCGIVLGTGPRSFDFVNRVNVLQKHRGPNNQSVETYDTNCGKISLGHQRLSIIGLDSSGSQPMASKSGDYVIIFNGEIYNYKELSREYSLNNLRSKTDTEVALELIEKIGIDEACRKFNGMWSLIVFDKSRERLYLSKDRVGKKPLNWMKEGKEIFIASEVRSFIDAGIASVKPNLLTAARFLTQSIQNMDVNTWIEGIYSFPAGCIGEIDLSKKSKNISKIRKYWDIEENLENSTEPKFSYPKASLENVISSAIDLRLHADVPVGIALSGGLDSSIIASRLKSSNQDVRLFSVVSPGDKDDESEFIDIVADYLDLKVEKFSMVDYSAADLMAALTECCVINDGPVSSFSPLLFLGLMKKAKSSGVTVVLTGQGADEAFCGYKKYSIFYCQSLLADKKILLFIRQLFLLFLRKSISLNFKYGEAKRYLKRPSGTILGSAAKLAMRPENLNLTSSLTIRQWVDIKHYSVPYLCHYEDRMSMAQSVEVRAPFLDYRVLEEGIFMTAEEKLKNGWTKYPLRKIFENVLPSKIAWRKDKKGFVNPQDKWFKAILNDPASEGIKSENAPIYTNKIVDRDAYLTLLEKYKAGDKSIWFREVFAPFTLNLWLEASKSKYKEI